MATLSFQFCTPEQQRISAQAGSPLHCLTRNESIALAFVTEAAALSLIACVVAYFLIFRKIRRQARRTPGKWSLIKVPMDVYLLSLFAADFVLAFGDVISGKWVREGKSEIGPWCSAQAIGITVGIMIVALTTLAIAVHTFVIVWCDKGLYATLPAKIAVVASWALGIIYATIIGSRHHKEPDLIFRPVPYWCWIGSKYQIHRLFGAYIWMWITLFVSVLLYIPLFFWGRGNITVGDKPWIFQIHRQRNIEDRGSARRNSLGMIAYPLVYAFLVIPLSVTRWIGFVQESHGDRKNHVSASVTLAARLLFSLSGSCNVLLVLLTRPSLMFTKKSNERSRNGNSSKTRLDADSIAGDEEE